MFGVGEEGSLSERRQTTEHVAEIELFAQAGGEFSSGFAHVINLTMMITVTLTMTIRTTITFTMISTPNVREPRAVLPSSALHPGLPGRRYPPVRGTGLLPFVRSLARPSELPPAGEFHIGPSQRTALTVVEPPPRTARSGVPSRADGTSPYLAVDNRAERIGCQTFAGGKALVKRNISGPQGYPPNSCVIHRSPVFTHRSSTRRPHVVYSAQSGKPVRGELVDGGAWSRLTGG